MCAFGPAHQSRVHVVDMDIGVGVGASLCVAADGDCGAGSLTGVGRSSRCKERRALRRRCEEESWC